MSGCGFVMLAGITLSLVTPSVHAQRNTRARLSDPTTVERNYRSRQATWLSLLQESVPKERTHSLEGAVLGGIIVGFLGAVTGLGLCHFDDPCANPAPFVVGGFVLGGAAGAALGARIGAGFPKH